LGPDAPDGLAGFGDVDDMAEVVRYVDPDATGAADGTSWTDAYTSLDAWEAAEQTDLVTAGDWHHVYVRASAGTIDSSELDLNGWTTGSSNYILIEAASGDEALKTGWDDTRYRLEIGGFEEVDISSGTDHVRFQGIQFQLNTGSSNRYLFNMTAGDGADIRFDSCRFRSIGAGTGGEAIRCAFSSGATREIIIQNSIFTGFTGPALNLSSTWNVSIYQTVIYDCGTGIGQTSSGSNVATNCAVFNCTDDFNATITIDHCASDDGDGTNAVAPSGSDWANEFPDYATGDFTLGNTGNLFQGGTTITGGPSTDIDGDSWGATPSIGADEYIAAGGGDVTVSLGALDHTHALDTVSITQTQNITVADSFHAHALDTVAIQQVQNIEIASMFHAGELDTVTLTQAQNIAIDGLFHGHINGVYSYIESPPFSGNFIETDEGLYLTQRQGISVDGLSHAHELDTLAVSLSDEISAIADDLYHAQVLDSVSLTQRHNITVSDMYHAHVVDGASLSPRVTVSVDDLTHAHTLDGVGYTQAHVIVIDDLTHEQSQGTVELTQSHLLAIQDLVHAHGLDSVNFTIADGIVTMTFTGKAGSATFTKKTGRIVWTQ
jgi:hypothetical protein